MEVNRRPTLHATLKSYAPMSFKKRETGALEVAHKLLGYSLYGMSKHVKWLGATMKGCRSRRLKEMKEIRKMDKNYTTIYNKNIIDNYYPNRY